MRHESYFMTIPLACVLVFNEFCVLSSQAGCSNGSQSTSASKHADSYYTPFMVTSDFSVALLSSASRIFIRPLQVKLRNLHQKGYSSASCKPRAENATNPLGRHTFTVTEDKVEVSFLYSPLHQYQLCLSLYFYLPSSYWSWLHNTRLLYSATFVIDCPSANGDAGQTELQVTVRLTDFSHWPEICLSRLGERLSQPIILYQRWSGQSLLRLPSRLATFIKEQRPIKSRTALARLYESGVYHVEHCGNLPEATHVRCAMFVRHASWRGGSFETEQDLSREILVCTQRSTEHEFPADLLESEGGTGLDLVAIFEARIERFRNEKEGGGNGRSSRELGKITTYKNSGATPPGIEPVHNTVSQEHDSAVTMILLTIEFIFIATQRDMIGCKSFYTIKDILLDQYQLGSPMVDDRPLIKRWKVQDSVHCSMNPTRLVMDQYDDGAFGLIGLPPSVTGDSLLDGVAGWRVSYQAPIGGSLSATLLGGDVVSEISISFWLLIPTVESDYWACTLLFVSQWLKFLQELSNNALTNGEDSPALTHPRSSSERRPVYGQPLGGGRPLRTRTRRSSGGVRKQLAKKNVWWQPGHDLIDHSSISRYQIVESGGGGVLTGSGGSLKKPADQRYRIPTCENMVTRPGIEPGSQWWEASVLTAWPPWRQGRGEYGVAPERKEGGWEIPEKTRRLAASSGNIPGVTPPGMEHSASWWDASVLYPLSHRGERLSRKEYVRGRFQSRQLVHATRVASREDLTVCSSQSDTKSVPRGSGRQSESEFATHQMNRHSHFVCVLLIYCVIKARYYKLFTLEYCVSVRARVVGDGSRDYKTASKKQRRLRLDSQYNAGMKGRGKREIPDKNSPTSGVVRHDSPHAKILERPRRESNPDRRTALVGGEYEREEKNNFAVGTTDDLYSQILDSKQKHGQPLITAWSQSQDLGSPNNCLFAFEIQFVSREVLITIEGLGNTKRISALVIKGLTTLVIIDIDFLARYKISLDFGGWLVCTADRESSTVTTPECWRWSDQFVCQLQVTEFRLNNSPAVNAIFSEQPGRNKLYKAYVKVEPGQVLHCKSYPILAKYAKQAEDYLNLMCLTTLLALAERLAVIRLSLCKPWPLIPKWRRRVTRYPQSVLVRGIGQCRVQSQKTMIGPPRCFNPFTFTSNVSEALLKFYFQDMNSKISISSPEKKFNLVKKITPMGYRTVAEMQGDRGASKVSPGSVCVCRHYLHKVVANGFPPPPPSSLLRRIARGQRITVAGCCQRYVCHWRAPRPQQARPVHTARFVEKCKGVRSDERATLSTPRQSRFPGRKFGNPRQMAIPDLRMEYDSNTPTTRRRPLRSHNHLGTLHLEKPVVRPRYYPTSTVSPAPCRHSLRRPSSGDGTLHAPFSLPSFNHCHHESNLDVSGTQDNLKCGRINGTIDMERTFSSAPALDSAEAEGCFLFVHIRLREPQTMNIIRIKVRPHKRNHLTISSPCTDLPFGDDIVKWKHRGSTSSKHRSGRPNKLTNRDWQTLETCWEAAEAERIFASRNRAGQRRWSLGLLRDLPFPPALVFRRCSVLASFHTHRLSSQRKRAYISSAAWTHP
ncbi:hypothetical protein PR048_028827 [Dryococelus australis]|uniref:Uncharacterized protein n=1 Tax=Dryococelus australis TaxID=614101 RepID=A0ABQ9GED9_9NEOP|nr:hypothetical protein PR048_028827 [Dryococelus australis]